ncbi:hypothetical protein ACFQ3Z_44385 [Streptomyces nogalater]
MRALLLEWVAGAPRLSVSAALAGRGLVTTVASPAGTAVVVGWAARPGTVRRARAACSTPSPGRDRGRGCRPATTRPSWCAATASC